MANEHSPQLPEDQNSKTPADDQDAEIIQAAKSLVDGDNGPPRDYTELMERAMDAADRALDDKAKLRAKSHELKEKHRLRDDAAWQTGRGNRPPSSDRHFSVYRQVLPDDNQELPLGYLSAGNHTVLEVAAQRDMEGRVDRLRVTNLTEKEVAQEGFMGYLNFSEVDVAPSTMRAVTELGRHDLLTRFSTFVSDGETVVAGRAKTVAEAGIAQLAETADMGLSRKHLAMRFLNEPDAPYPRVGLDVADLSTNGTDFYPQPNTEFFPGEQKKWQFG